MGDKSEIAFTSDLSVLEDVRAFVHQATAFAELSATTLYHLQLVIIEAVTNVIEHAYQGEPDQPIWLEIGRDGPDLAVTLRDRGLPFDIASHPDPDIRQHFVESRKGGLGVYLMRKLMDGLDLAREDGLNILRMRIKLDGAR